MLDDARDVRDVARERGGSTHSARVQWRMRLPSSVTNGRPSSTRSSGSHPSSRSSRSATGSANGITSTGSGARSPSRATSFVSSATTTIRRAADATDLLAQVRAAQPLDQVEVRVDLVGAVDHDVELGDVVERQERDPQLAAARRGRGRRGHAGDVRRAPEASRSPSASSIFAAVEPLPSPSRIPERTYRSTAAAPASTLSASRSPRHAAIASATASASVSGARQANRSQM